MKYILSSKVSLVLFGDKRNIESGSVYDFVHNVG